MYSLVSGWLIRKCQVSLNNSLEWVKFTRLEEGAGKEIKKLSDTRASHSFIVRGRSVVPQLVLL